MAFIIPQTSGIYVIKCEKNGKIYVGSSDNLKRRWLEHRTALRRGKHCNQHLQNAWNKYGEKNFKFLILDFCSPDKLIEREQYWLDKLQPFDKTKGFNIALDAISPMRGRTFTDEHKRKIGLAHRGKVIPDEIKLRYSLERKGIPRKGIVSEATREKLRKSRQGKKNSPEHSERMAETKRKEYIIIFPDGSEERIRGLRRFCRLYNLDDGALIKVAKGQQKTHKGFKCKYV